MSVKHVGELPILPPCGPVSGPVVDSDPGTATSSNAPGGLVGRRTCHAHCVWLAGKQTKALTPPPCEGKKIKPSTLMYDEWFIQHGDRVRNANFPLTAELCAQHRLGYADYKTKNKCTQIGCWNKGVLIPTGGGLGCALRAETKLVGKSVDGTKSCLADHSRGIPRHPAAKSAKIHNVESDSQRSNDSEDSSGRAVSSKRVSMDSVETGGGRVCTGPERTPAGSDIANKSYRQLPSTTTCTNPSSPAGGST